jgi:pimeloyl-ACP methyl ester carboxylesterase
VPLLTIALRFRPTGRLAIRRALQDMSFNDRYITPEVVDGYRLPLTLKGTRRAYFSMFRDIIDEGPAHGEPITAPVLVIAGRHDTVINQKVTDRIAGRIEGAELRVIDDGAHMLPDEHPEFIAAAIREVAERAYGEVPVTPR